jgi:soluble lytic murein transglycosylase-like protein
MEPKISSSKADLNAWLVRLTGPRDGMRHFMRGEIFRVGRDLSNDVVLDGPEAAVVSALHMEIRKEGGIYRLFDLDSTNGTFVNGKRVTETTLQPRSLITLGPNGPQFQFELDVAPSQDLAQTLVASEALPMQASSPIGKVSAVAPAADRPFDEEQEALLTEAVKKARQARRAGIGGQTGMIMRKMLGTAIHRSSRKFKLVICFLVVALISVVVYGAWTIQNLKKQKTNIDAQINQIEAKLQAAGNDPKQVDALVEELSQYQNQAREMQRNLLYRLGVRSEEQDFIESEIKALMAEFGAEEYSLPPEFAGQVRELIRWHQGPGREYMERLLGRSRKELDAARRQLQDDNLPPDLAYMALVESAFIKGSASSAGAVGLWQFTPSTARAYGLVVTDKVDERLNPRKSTQAAGRYIRELILDFGAGSSVMLALAAYNLGPGKVKRAVRTVSDPIKERNFWYLYRVRALPPETRSYIPKIIAAIIIGRHPERFGF